VNERLPINPVPNLKKINPPEKDSGNTMKIPLLLVISLIFLILMTGCMTQPSTTNNPGAAVTTNQIPATPTSVFPESSKFTTLITVIGRSGKTSDTFFVPGGY
jgi:hypothetical protein